VRLDRQSWITVGVASVFAAIGGVAGAFVLRAQDSIAETEVEIRELRVVTETLAREAALEPELREELAELESNVDLFVGILPAPEVATVERLMAKVYEHCGRTNVGIQRWSTVRAPRARRKGARQRAFTELRVKLELEGQQASLLELFNRLEREKALIRVNAFTLSAPGSELVYENKPLRATLDVSTFRYDAGV
jgi:hypothetical protein